MMSDLEAMCRSYSSGRMKPGMWGKLFDAIAAERGINRNKQVFEIGERELKDWVDKKIAEYDNAYN